MEPYTEREIQEMQFARLYKEKFCHDTPNHNHLVLIAKLADEVIHLRSLVLLSGILRETEEK